MAANTVLRLDSTTKTFAVDKAPPYAYTINYSDGSSADHQVRFFTPLLGSGAQRYEVDTPPSFNAGFEVEFKFYGLPQNNKKVFSFCDSSNDLVNLDITDDGTITYFSKGVDGNTKREGVINIGNTKLNTINLIYDPSTTNEMTVKVNTITDISFSVPTGRIPDLTDIIAMKFGVESTFNGGGLTGYLADFKVINGSTLVIDSPIDKQYTAAAPTVINKADASNNLTAVNLDSAGSEFTSSDTYGWLGENNVGSPTRISDDWTNNGDGSYTLDTPDGNYSDCELQFGISEVGFTYFVEVTVNEPVGNSNLRMRNCVPSIDLPTAGDYSGLVIAEIPGFPNINRRGGARPFVQTIFNISNRQVLEVAS